MIGNTSAEQKIPSVVQTTGQSTEAVMSQKVVSDELSLKANASATATITDNSTVALSDNTEYSGTNLTTVTFTYPQGDFECYLSLSFASSGTLTVTFPTSSSIGEAPTFANDETWELSIKRIGNGNAVVIAGKVEASA